MPGFLQILFKEFELKLGKFSLPVTYWEAGAIIFLLFLLIISMAQFRHHWVHWSLKGTLVGLIFGVIFTLILEGFLLIKGKTILTSFLSWKNPPIFISKTLDAGKSKLIQVLGVNTQSVDIISNIQSLSPSELSKIKSIICK